MSATEVSGDEVFTGLVQCFLAAEVETGGDFGPFVLWSNDTKDQARVGAMLARSDRRAQGSGHATWRVLDCEWQAIYPRTVEGIAHMIADARIVERIMRDTPARMLALDVPVGTDGSLKPAEEIRGPDFDYPDNAHAIMKAGFRQPYFSPLETT